MGCLVDLVAGLFDISRVVDSIKAIGAFGTHRRRMESLWRERPPAVRCPYVAGIHTRKANHRRTSARRLFRLCCHCRESGMPSLPCDAS